MTRAPGQCHQGRSLKRSRDQAEQRHSAKNLSPLIAVSVVNGFLKEQGLRSMEGNIPFFDLDYLTEPGIADRLPVCCHLVEVAVYK